MTFWAKTRETPSSVEPNKQHKSTRNIQTFHTNPTMSEEGECEEGEWRRVSEERWLQKTNFNHLTRLGRLQARSGYIGPMVPPGLPAKRRRSLRILPGRGPAPGFWDIAFHFHAPTSRLHASVSSFDSPLLDFLSPFWCLISRCDGLFDGFIWDFISFWHMCIAFFMFFASRFRVIILSVF